MKRSFVPQSGITLIEVLVAVSIVSAILVVVGFSVTSFVEARSRLLVNTEALYLAEEGYEIVRALRNDDWATIDGYTVDTTYYLDVATTTIAIGGTPEVIDGTYYRSIIFREVYRDGNDDITASTTPGATVDPDMREVEIAVFGPTGTTTLRAIIGNIFSS